MDTSLELHDSVVDRLSRRGRDVIASFSAAYIHRSGGMPGHDAGTVWLQPARLILIDVRDAVECAEALGRISDGYIRAGDHILDNLIPASLECLGEIEIGLVFDSSRRVVVHSGGARLELLDEPSYLEEFPGVPNPEE